MIELATGGEFQPLTAEWGDIYVELVEPDGWSLDEAGYYLPFSPNSDGKPQYLRFKIVYKNPSVTGLYDIRHKVTGKVWNSTNLNPHFPAWITAENLRNYTRAELLIGMNISEALNRQKISNIYEYEARPADMARINKIGSQLKIGDIVQFSGQRDLNSARLITEFDGLNVVGQKLEWDRQAKDWRKAAYMSRNFITTITKKWVDRKWKKIGKKVPKDV